MSNYDDLNPQPSSWTAWAIIPCIVAGLGVTIFTVILAVVEMV